MKVYALWLDDRYYDGGSDEVLDIFLHAEKAYRIVDRLNAVISRFDNGSGYITVPSEQEQAVRDELNVIWKHAGICDLEHVSYTVAEYELVE